MPALTLVSIIYSFEINVLRFGEAGSLFGFEFKNCRKDTLEGAPRHAESDAGRWDDPEYTRGNDKDRVKGAAK